MPLGFRSPSELEQWERHVMESRLLLFMTALLALWAIFFATGLTQILITIMAVITFVGGLVTGFVGQMQYVATTGERVVDQVETPAGGEE